MFPFEHIISIDKEKKLPVYRQIAISIINAIRNGNLHTGMPLPSTRELAKLLDVHRKTVTAAYEELNAQDWILIIPRKQVRVSEHIPNLEPQKWNAQDSPVSYENNFNLPLHPSKKDPSQKQVVTVSQISIDDGHPDIRLSPIDELLKIYRSYTSKTFTIKNAVVGITQGTLKLREELSRYLSVTRGLNISADNVLITHGAQMSIYLSAQLLLQEGDTIILGKPGYPIANSAFEKTKACVVEIPVDENGLDINALENICKRKKVTAVYIIPHHHYPTTVTLSVERRMKLLELSNRYSFAVIEDDYDYDYHYSSSPYLPLASGTHTGNIIYIGSFSKTIGSSIRIGFMVAPKNFIQEAVTLRKMIDIGGDGYMQNALAELIKNGDLGRHLKKTKKCYHQRRDYLNRLLHEHLSRYVSFSLPDGGLSVWIQLKHPYSIHTLKMSSQLQINRICEEENSFRFGFASMNEKELEEAILLVKKILTTE
ncbi:PLP-dependent aminotransferase family protein [Chryseobacterium sp. CH21]|uniref:MocR-like pyridoxine biosynthesis transcription factor PdxR n=1 Tax=Chryseobacterium sp. CH21 TaxID=713556 RepID=UPI00100B5BBA|nr:PLP-dependent aminotransferase family protein [Chryseobacterium sp. CH21]RXM39122.1 PLP-dependent aminotransferase family protein [Chryseobacterium sp. CH21]